MRAKRLTYLALVLILAVTGLWGEDEGEPVGGDLIFTRFPSALGGYACYPTTGGLTYQRWFGRFGLEATLGGLAQPAGPYEYAAQGAFQYMLYGEDFADWFSGGLYTNVLLAHRGVGSNAAEGAMPFTPIGYVGLGVGIEMVILRHLSTSVEFMYVGSTQMVLEFGFAGSLKYRF